MCKGKCQNLCASPKCSATPPDADIADMRELLHECMTRNPGMTMDFHAPRLNKFLDELEDLRRERRADQKPVVLHTGAPPVSHSIKPIST